MRQKNIVFSGLLTYCDYMIMLGTSILIQEYRFHSWSPSCIGFPISITSIRNTKLTLPKLLPHPCRSIKINDIFKYFAFIEPTNQSFLLLSLFLIFFGFLLFVRWRLLFASQFSMVIRITLRLTFFFSLKVFVFTFILISNIHNFGLLFLFHNNFNFPCFEVLNQSI
jgi:hypothetical protein